MNLPIHPPLSIIAISLHALQLSTLVSNLMFFVEVTYFSAHLGLGIESPGKNHSHLLFP